MFNKRWLNLIFAFIMLFTAIFCQTGCDTKKFTVTFESGAQDAVLEWGIEKQNVSNASQIIMPVYTRPGYNFVGWDRSISMITESTTIKAQWREYEFEVRFQSNGGKTEDGKDYVVVKTGSAFDLKLNQPKFIKKGFRLSWDKELSSITESCTINAVWTPQQYVLEFFDKDGLPFNNNKMRVTYNEVIEDIPVVAPNVQGMRFAYWSQGKSADAITLDKGIVWRQDEGAKLYANYVEQNEYIISYDLDGGEIGKRIYSYNSSISEDVNILFDAEREGYNFEGWLIGDNKTPKLSNKITIKDFKQNGRYTDVRLKASWGNRPYIINYDTQGGYLTGETSKQVMYNQKVGQLPTVEKEGYLFVGWYYDGKIITEDEIWKYPSDATLTAKYLAEYNIKFSLSTTIKTNQKVIECMVTNFGSIPHDKDLEEVTLSLIEGQSLYTAYGYTKMPVVSPIEQSGKDEYEFGGYWKWIERNGSEHIITTITVFSLEIFSGVEGGETIVLVPHCRANWSPNA